MKVIQAENISKQYRLGMVGTGTIVSDMQRFFAKIRGKEDPTLKIGVENKLDSAQGDYVWALRDINFSIEKGEVLGIIGKNGAGKSTLLKILSKVTSPTTGSIKIKGRIASLLEVGTGFHSELSGRENIFLNGAILGMTKAEIRRKFEEIVDFAGVKKYIDTPVKRYSSGMYVRLAFAVAAHLEPEILIIDEVLAVGDAEFQKKALGKMKDVSGQGRTVLFVSHNMTAIKTLCKNALLLRQGKIDEIGIASEVVNNYVKQNSLNLIKNVSYNTPEEAMGNENIRIKKISVLPYEITIDDEIILTFEFWNISGEKEIKIAFDLLNLQEQIVFGSGTDIVVENGSIGKVSCHIPANLLNDDTYNIHLFFFTTGMRSLCLQYNVVSFEVRDKNRSYAYYGKINGAIRPVLKWET
jgi:lipopolysaccharide transport system ATP-binding protein